MMRVIGILLLTAFAAGAAAQNDADTGSAPPVVVPPQTAETALTIGSDFLALLDEDMPSAYHWLQATVSVEDKAAGVSWAPFLAGRTYNEWFSETRFQVGQKDGKTNVGVVLRWNPLSPRSDRGMDAWENAKPPAFGEDYAKLRTLREQVVLFQDNYLEIERPGILALRKRVTDLRERLEKIGIDDATRTALTAELKAASEALGKLRDEARLKRRTDLETKIKAKRSTLDAETDPMKREVLIRELEQLFASIAPAGGELAVLDAEIAATEKALGKKFATTIASFEQALYSRPLPVISLSYTASLFPGLGSSFVDADADALDDNAHVLAGRSLLLSGLMRFGPKNQLSIGAGRSWKLSSAEEGTPTAKSDNYAVTYARRLRVLDPDYQKSEEYLSSLFVPSIVGGLSAELSECGTALATCQDKAESILALTPFVDVKLKKAAQFRLGVTWKKFSGSDIADEELGVVTLVSLQLGLPN